MPVQAVVYTTCAVTPMNQFCQVEKNLLDWCGLYSSSSTYIYTIILHLSS